MSRVRTFIAVNAGAEIRHQLLALQRKLTRAAPDVKWVEEANLHLTLLFLGEVRDRDLPAICLAVARAASEVRTFSMEVKGVGCFPNVRRPRIVWAGIGEGAAKIGDLHDRLETPLDALGCYRREERQYTPHITLGRTKSDEPSDRLAEALREFETWQGGETQVREVLVMSSELRSQGPEYTVLGRGKLKG